MALCRTGASVLNSFKPILINPCFFVPSSINFQVRYAARKGYRDKQKRAKKEAAKNAPAVEKDTSKIKLGKNISKFVKTSNLNKPEPPNDDVVIINHFNYKKFSLPEAVKLHREYHHPTVYNNPNAPVSVKIEINMVGKSQFKFIKPFKGVVTVPHPFVISHKKDVLVLCNSEDVELALSCGASIAGGVDVVKKIQEGVIQPTLYNYVISHISFLPHLTPIRNLLKDRLPRAKTGTLTSDLKSAINRFLNGIEYACIPGKSDDFGIIVCNIGTINMELNQLEENLKALIADIEKNKPLRDGDFITWIWCMSPPSKEEFSIDISTYVENKVKKEDDHDDEEEEMSSIHEEKRAARELMYEYKENTLMKDKA